MTRVYRVGGAQAVAALAFGTEQIPRVDKIVGPGNAYVQEAKRLVFGHVAIDSEAGPSEVLIVADASARADLLAADLLAQAEHDELRQRRARDAERRARGARCARRSTRQLAALRARRIAPRRSRDRSALIVTRDLDEACELANRYARRAPPALRRGSGPLAGADRARRRDLPGPYSPVPIGDYVAGPSHVLPTGGTARFFSALGVEDFQHRMSLIELDAPAFAAHRPGRRAPGAARGPRRARARASDRARLRRTRVTRAVESAHSQESAMDRTPA